jgi:hypothetical protein
VSSVLEMDSQVQPYIDRWMAWVDGGPCANGQDLIWPDNITGAFDKEHFCQTFQTTARTVWTHFLTDPTDGYQQHQPDFIKDCGLQDISNPDQNLINACIIQHIVGYNSGVLGGTLPGQVQALLRGVAYDADGNGRQYQFDPFLTFGVPFSSQFALDPFTRLIHSNADGIAAVSYSFSIDDKYGNFRDASSGFIVDAGGTTALDNKQPYDPYQQYKMNWGYNRGVYTLVTLQPDLNLAVVEPQLEAFAEQNQNQAVLIRQADNLAVLGQTGDKAWKLTNPLVTLDQLRTLAKDIPEYQGVIDHTFGDSSVFPATALDLSAPNPTEIGSLDFDAPNSWPTFLLGDFVLRESAAIPPVGNWVSGSVCGVDVALNGPGSQRLPLAFQNGGYNVCTIKVIDSFGGSMSLDLRPPLQDSTDAYTGATVSAYGLPIGDTFSGEPLVTSTLSAGDLQACQHNSSLPDLCQAVTLSATWANDPLARDVVYMGLDPKAMPRVNVNLPAAPKLPPDAQQVTWPPDASISAQAQSDGTVLVSWPAARILSGARLQYLLYVRNGTNWDPVPGCDQTSTSCRAKLADNAQLYVIAVNNSGSPAKQTPQLFGCYPSSAQCGASAQSARP